MINRSNSNIPRDTAITNLQPVLDQASMKWNMSRNTNTTFGDITTNNYNISIVGDIGRESMNNTHNVTKIKIDHDAQWHLKQEILNLTKNKYFDYNLYNLIHNQTMYVYWRKVNIETQAEMLKSYFKSNSNSSLKWHIDKKITLVESEFSYDKNKCYIYCGVFKAASTKMDQILIYLTRNKIVYQDIHNRHLRNKITSVQMFYKLLSHANLKSKSNSILNQNETQNNNNSKNATKFKHWVKFAMIRDPLKRLLSGFLDKCISRYNIHIQACSGLFGISNRSKQHLILQKYFNTSSKEQEMLPHFRSNVTFVKLLFASWIDRLSKYRIFFTLNGKKNLKSRRSDDDDDNYKKHGGSPNRHWIPQIYWCGMYRFIQLFDYIIIYDKMTFAHNVRFILTQIVWNAHGNNNNITSEVNLNSTNIHNNQTVVIQDRDKVHEYVDMLVKELDVTGESQESHHNIRTIEEEMGVLRKYYTKETALKAMKMYLLDYHYLPLEPPLWIADLPSDSQSQ